MKDMTIFEKYGNSQMIFLSYHFFSDLIDSNNRTNNMGKRLITAGGVLTATLFGTSYPSQAADGRAAGQGNLPGETNHSIRGVAITHALGNRLQELAQRYGKSAEELGRHCEHDHDLVLGGDGKLHCTCASLAIPENGQSTTKKGGGTAEGSFPPEQTFFLHSAPGATKVIYLDLDGHVTSGTFWNSDYNEDQDIVTPAYDIDGNPATFSQAELDNIQAIWQQVAEDYAPFEVDVTTEDPGIEALRKTSPTDETYGQRVVIGGDSAWIGGPFGGVAEIGTFNWDSDVPCFVFPAHLSNGDAKSTAEASSHEAGHTLGLFHDGVLPHDGIPGLSYYYGHGNWAPIMGVAYNREVSHWSKGDYPFANNQEDDLAIIQSFGVPLRIDSHGDSQEAATVLTGFSFANDSLIETRTDSDWFSFTTGAGNVFLGAAVADVSPNLDVELSLFDQTGQLVLTSAPSDRMGAEIFTDLAAGTYFLKVDGIGAGSPLTSYDDYDSLGQYHFATLTVPTSGVPPVAVADSSGPLSGPAPHQASFSSLGSNDPNGSIVSYLWDFGDGTTSTQANPMHTYAGKGNYVASLVVTDNSGLPGLDYVNVTVTSIPPVGVITATPSWGVAPQGVIINASGSNDPDGSITSYAWDFGDGTTGSGLSAGVHNYTTSGVYNLALTLTDNDGTTSLTTKKITVFPSNTAIYISNIAMSLTNLSGGYRTATAAVKVLRFDGTPMRNANVTVQWTGLTNESKSAKTNAQGVATITSSKSRNSGTFTATVTNVVLSGSPYFPAANVETTDSISTP